MRSRTIGALALAACAACENEAEDSGGAPDTETDADTDADADTDTDADTDPEGWAADAILVSAHFGYDATTGEIRTATWVGDPQPNSVTAMVLNRADVTTSQSPTQFCFFDWTLPEGPFGANGDFPDEYWLSFDLTDAPISHRQEIGTTVGDCDGLQSFFGTARDGDDLATFAQTFGIGFGIESLEDVAPATLEDWRVNVWPAEQAESFGPWDQQVASLVAGAFTVQGSGPHEADVLLALEVDESTWSVVYDPATNSSPAVDMTGRTAAPTGYYVSIVLYTYTG